MSQEEIYLLLYTPLNHLHFYQMHAIFSNDKCSLVIYVLEKYAHRRQKLTIIFTPINTSQPNMIHSF